MPYQIAHQELLDLGEALSEYYLRAWEQGIRGLADNMARSQMGIVTGYLDQAADTYASVRRKSNDQFGIAFKGELKRAVGVYFINNKHDIAIFLVGKAEAALTALAKKIPIPVLDTIVKKAIKIGAQEARNELLERARNEADSRVVAQSGGEVGKLFTNEAEAATSVANSMEQYKLIGRFIETMPRVLTSFDDVVAFPGAVFKVQKAASTLNVQLLQVKQYLEAMQERLDQIRIVSDKYVADVRTTMPESANEVLQTAYDEAYAKGEQDVARNDYRAPTLPPFTRPPKSTGGATQLAIYLAHAVAQGYYDAGNRGPVFGRGRSNAVFEAPPVTRPRSNAIIGVRPPFTRG